MFKRPEPISREEVDEASECVDFLVNITEKLRGACEQVDDGILQQYLDHACLHFKAIPKVELMTTYSIG